MPLITHQHVVQAVMEYIEDLFTDSPRETFSRVEILVILNTIKDDPDIVKALKLLDAAEV